ncbi:unnamed protein product [Brassicogethes aeneus]|uniref:DUF4371 domain-containing protein n=1 Tax=Brassicogethes aeneus TaxID=1431903 RepID=A0A9P0BGN8_BRAAE|nr:unnamed protein product [Brassicogethes aeneus]
MKRTYQSGAEKRKRIREIEKCAVHQKKYLAKFLATRSENQNMGCSSSSTPSDYVDSDKGSTNTEDCALQEKLNNQECEETVTQNTGCIYSRKPTDSVDTNKGTTNTENCEFQEKHNNQECEETVKQTKFSKGSKEQSKFSHDIALWPQYLTDKMVEYYLINTHFQAIITKKKGLSVSGRIDTLDIKERFFGFIPIERHDAAYLEKVVLESLQNLGFDIKNCRGQTYDNAANMSGQYNGLQAKLKEHVETATYIPCASHTLNLIENSAAESCSGALHYFNFIQNIYVYFSSSTRK